PSINAHLRDAGIWSGADAATGRKGCCGLSGCEFGAAHSVLSRFCYELAFSSSTASAPAIIAPHGRKGRPVIGISKFVTQIPDAPIGDTFVLAIEGACHRRQIGILEGDFRRWR